MRSRIRLIMVRGVLLGDEFQLTGYDHDPVVTAHVRSPTIGSFHCSFDLDLTLAIHVQTPCFALLIDIQFHLLREAVPNPYDEGEFTALRAIPRTGRDGGSRKWVSLPWEARHARHHDVEMLAR